MDPNGVTTAPSDDAARLAAIVRSVADGIVTVDSRGAIDSLNPAAEELFGLSEAEATGRSFAALLADPFQDEYAGHMREHARGETIALIGRDREIIGRRADGSTFPMELRLTDLRPMDQRMLVAVARDIGERKRAEAHLRQQSDHDPATDLLNRHAFESELTRHVQHAARYGGAGSVVELAIDHAGAAPGRLGPEAEAPLLNEVADLLRRRLRRTDVIARLGPDRFGALLHGAGRAKAAAVAQELVDLIREHPFEASDPPVGVTASAGVAAVEERPVTGGILLTESATAVREATEQGGDRVVSHSPDGLDEEEDRRRWSERMREATERGLFVLACQPIVEIEGGRIAHHELLLRIRGEDGELGEPGDFLANAERFGLMGAVDRWVTRRAVLMTSGRGDADDGLPVEVNLSGATLADSNFAAEVASMVSAPGADPARIIFEVGEAAALEDVDATRRMAEELAALGCRFALDDFGAGIASFQCLTQLPLSLLKIDGELVRDLPREEGHRLIIRALVEVCRELDIATVAEAVEDEETFEALRDLGVHYAQGFYLGHPLPVSDLAPEPAHAGSEPA